MIPDTAILLVAGVGSRLRPLTDDRPKCMVNVGAMTILARAVKTLQAAGVRRFVASCGYRAEALEQHLRSLADDVLFVSNADYDRTQNIVSLHRALDALEPGTPFVKLDGDVLFRSSVLKALATVMYASSQGARRGAVAVERSATLGQEEMKVIVREGRATAFGKGLDPALATGESIGIECFDREASLCVSRCIREAVLRGDTQQYYEDAYNLALDAVSLAPAFVESTDWTEIDDVADLARAEALIESWRTNDGAGDPKFPDLTP